MTVQEELDRQIKAWLKEKRFDRVSLQLPFVNVPDFPDTSPMQMKRVPKLTASVERLGISSSMGVSVPALASLISVMERRDAETLYTRMSKLAAPVDLDEELAHNWFAVCHKLSTKTMIPAVLGFFKLAELHRSKDFQMELLGSLACWYKVLTAPNMQNNQKVEILLDVAEQFPDRFAFVCIRVVSGGEKVLSAAGEALFALNCLDLSTEESASILDFTMETGWLLDRHDHDQIWKLISQKGSSIQGRLSGGLVPMNSIRFLAGLLRGIEETKGLDVLLASERIHRAMIFFNVSSSGEMKRIFALYPQLEPLIDHQIKQDLTVEAISHRIEESDQSKLGYSVAVFLEKFLGGITIAKMCRFLSVTGDELSSEVVIFLKKLVLETDKGKELSSSEIIQFSGIVSKILPFSIQTDRTALKAFYRALTDMDHSLKHWAILQLDEATSNGVAITSVLSASSLLLRASDESNRKEFLSRIRITGRLLDTLSSVDRKKTLSSLVPVWVEILISFSRETEEKVIEFLCRVNDVDKRKRYLENVVTHLLGDVNPEDPIFEDCLAFAVNGYNSTEVIEKLREIEHNVLKKVFRAGGRIEVVDGLMVDLLAVPGFEGEKTEHLISGIRSICTRFSRLAVWEEEGDSLFSDFIVNGVGNILRAFVDNPSSLDLVNGDTIKKLLEKLIPEASNSTKTSGIINPGGTAQAFFGSILPGSISLFGREAKSLSAFLFEIADEFSRSVGGMTAGEDFARYLVTRLDLEIQQDCVTVLGSWLSRKTPPPLHISEKWSNRKREEWNGLKRREDTTRMKLFNAVSALAAFSESHTRESILNTAGFLSRQMKRAGIPGVAGLSLKWNRTMMDELLALSGDTSPLAFFKGEVSGVKVSSELYSYLESFDGFMEQDIFHAWRQIALPPLLNCAVEVVLVSGSSPGLAAEMAEAATDAVEFLGYNSANSFLSTLQESFRHATSPDHGFALMEKNFLLPLWKRNSEERLDLLLLGMKNCRLLANILRERLFLEERVEGKVKFMRNYATFFITVEKALLNIQSDFEKSKIADGLMDSWIFSGAGNCSKKSVSEISETAELVQDLFRRIKYGGGIVSASEAGEISADMRRKYRDNADSVAIILRWTVDPAREGLLQLLEESQLLLQAAGSDSELMRLLDIHGAGKGFLQSAKPYSKKPAALKKYLQALPVMVERE